MPRYIDADTVVTIQVYDDMTEEWDLKKMTIAEAIDKWSDEGCPPTVDAVEDIIYRWDAIELAMQYCPDDDGTCSKADEDMRNLLDELEDLPPAVVDAEPVVRCKDCKWCHAGYCEKADDIIPFGFAHHEWENFYCAWGEKREDGNS